MADSVSTPAPPPAAACPPTLTPTPAAVAAQVLADRQRLADLHERLIAATPAGHVLDTVVARDFRLAAEMLAGLERALSDGTVYMTDADAFEEVEYKRGLDAAHAKNPTYAVPADQWVRRMNVQFARGAECATSFAAVA